MRVVTKIKVDERAIANNGTVRARRLARFLGAVVLVLTYQQSSASSLSPAVSYKPAEVVQIVIEALRTNNESDDGIAIVFRFASPGNRQSTGPMERFTQMIKQGFGDMLNHLDSEVEPVQVRDNKAIQPVWLITESGREVGYLFQLGLQSEGEYTGMWMTEAVYPIRSRGQSI